MGYKQGFECYYTYVSIPISALQRNAAEVVRKMLASGQSVDITDRGRVVALLSPPRQSGGLQRLRDMGMTRQADPQALQKGLARISGLPALDLAGALNEQRDSDR